MTNNMNAVDHLTDWVNLYSDELFAWVLKRTQDVQLSEDLVQETFIAAHQSLNNFKGDSSPKTWLNSILKYKMIDHFRKQKVKDKYENEELFFNANESWKNDNNPAVWSDVETHLLDNPMFNDTLSNCLANLPTNMKIAISSKYLMEKKAEDICKEMSITTSNYWQIVRRAKLNLRNCLELNWFEKL